MPPVSPVLAQQSLVPAARFGAALHRERSQSGVTMASLARESDGRFLPDQLVAVERGEVALHDGDIRLLAELYGLADRPWAPASALELVLDRASMSEFDADAHAPTGPVPSRHDYLTGVAARFLALSVSLGVDVTSGPIGIDVLADAVESSVEATLELVETVLRTGSATVGTLIAELEGRVAVPEVGFLVAETTTGSLLFVARGPVSDTTSVPACGTLAELLEAAR